MTPLQRILNRRAGVTAAPTTATAESPDATTREPAVMPSPSPTAVDVAAGAVASPTGPRVSLLARLARLTAPIPPAAPETSPTVTAAPAEEVTSPVRAAEIEDEEESTVAGGGDEAADVGIAEPDAFVVTSGENPIGALPPLVRDLLEQDLAKRLDALADGLLRFDPEEQGFRLNAVLSKPRSRASVSATVRVIPQLAAVLGYDLDQPDDRLAEYAWGEGKQALTITRQHAWSEMLPVLEKVIARYDDRADFRTGMGTERGRGARARVRGAPAATPVRDAQTPDEAKASESDDKGATNDELR